MSLSDALSKLYSPMQSAGMKDDIVYVTRLLLKDGTPMVVEKRYDNVWIRFADYLRNKPNFVSAEVTRRSPDATGKGYHSNVLSTEGFAGQTMALLQAKSSAGRDEIRNYLATFK